MNQRTNTKQSGFTLIELMLSMTFVAVLLVTIALTIIQMANVYNRGMTLKEVNQSARDVADDLRRTAASSQVFAVNADGSDSTDSFAVRTGSTVVGGRLCTGTYSYLWNLAKATEAPINANATQTLNTAGIVQGPITFVKIPDNGKKYCQKASGVVVNKHITAADAKIMTDLLDAGDHKLGIQEFTITTSDSSFDALTKQRIYSVSYTIGSGATSAMNATQSGCLAPGTPNANIAYCNVQKFTIVLRVGNTVN